MGSLLSFHPLQHLLRPAQPVVHAPLLERSLNFFQVFQSFFFLAHVGIGMNSPQPATASVRSETERDIDGVNKALSPGIKPQFGAHLIHHVAE